ncbi:MAG: hypothetical protein V2I38_02160 [Alcanivoracaceae bacterium]|jgi:hypothetical protein|nr:hypothetical protein [Alcanivoracaceae bacterium]
MKKIILAVALAASVFLSGCATIFVGKHQEVAISPSRGGVVDPNLVCTVMNSKGAWTTNGGGVVTVEKSRGDLRVQCRDPETGDVAEGRGARSTVLGWAVLNFFVWDFCTISCAIDFATGSIYEYPQQVTMLLPEAPKRRIAPAVKQYQEQGQGLAPEQGVKIYDQEVSF